MKSEHIIYEVTNKLKIAIIDTKGQKIFLRNNSSKLFATLKSLYIVDVDPAMKDSNFKCLIQPEKLKLDKNGRVV